MVTFHVDALVVYRCQVGPATPGGSGAKEAQLRGPDGCLTQQPSVKALAPPIPALRTRQS